MDEYVRDFVQESEENITTLNNALLRLENDPDDDAAMEEIFRTAHTLKGNSGAMGFTDASDLAHALEDLLETVRSGNETVTPELMDQVFEGVDLLEAMVDEVRRHGEPQTDPSTVIDALREQADSDSDGITDPDESAVENLLSAVNAPADSAHDVYHVRLAIAESDGSDNGVRVVEALRDAFDLLGTDPPEAGIEEGDYGGVFDAGFASPVGESAISAALEPVDAVDDAIITSATDIAAATATADETDAAAAREADAEGETADAEATVADDMSVDELLDDDDVDQFDDLDDMVDEVDDMEGLDDLGEAGSFADVDAEPDISSIADESDGDPDVDDILDAETSVEGADAGETESEPETDGEVEDASRTFAELQEEVDPVGFDELQDELDELEFDELDEDDEVGFDELIGDETDEDDFAPFDGDDEPAGDVDIEDGLAGNVDVEDDLLDVDDSEESDAFGDVAFGEDDAADDLTASAAGDDSASADAADDSVADGSVPDDVTASAGIDDADTTGDDGGLSADTGSDDALGDLDFGEGVGADDDTDEDESTHDSAADDDPFGDIDFGGTSESDDAASVDSSTATAATTTDAAADDSPADATTADDEPTAEDGAEASTDDTVDTGGFGDVDIDDSGSVVDTTTAPDEEFEGFDSPDTDDADTGSEADAETDAAETGADEMSAAAGDDNAKDGSAADQDEPDDGGSRDAIDQSGPSTDADDIQSVRVGVEDIDSLMNLVEGMVTSRVRLRRAIERGESLAVLDDELDELEDITGELQDTVMDIRLVPLSTVTNKLPRIVRDISREQDKRVTFEMNGADVEIDRTILNDIGDPLVHIVRNAVDHGIEPPDEREKAGKDPDGTIELRARRERDEVVIEVEDDGRGLDVDRIRTAAAEESIATESELVEMDDDEVYDLIFHSGFSTTETVTDVSGRGVGMDVVASTVDDLDGSVNVESGPGEGTTVRLRLPVTVAIADVLFVQSGDEEYGIPIKNVQEIGAVDEIETVDGEEIVRRNETEYPLIRLSESLDTPSNRRNDDGMVVRIRDEIRPVAIKCDHVRGQQEVVVKPYEGVLGDIPGLSGATVLGEGDVVNILDVESL